jgi:predicted aconitase
MQLTDEEKRMLDGDFGAGVQKAMSMVVKVGEIFGAEKTVPVSSVQHIPLEPMDWLLEMAQDDTKVRAFTGTHSYYYDPDSWKSMGIDDKRAREEEVTIKQHDELYRVMGIVPLYTCAPYNAGNTPMYGSFFAWGGSAGQVLANSLLGARGDRVGGPLCLAAGITGRVPYSGVMRPENRYGQFLVEIEDGLKLENFTYAEYGALSYYLGALAGTKNVVFNGIPKTITPDELKYLFSPLPVSGGAVLCHVVGVTPEALTLEAALHNKKPEQKIIVGKNHLREGWEKLHTATSNNVDLVHFGCPHCSIREIQYIAQWLDGKKVSPNVKLWIGTSSQTRLLARKAGLADILERAGAVLTNICISEASIYLKSWGINVKVLAVDSPRSAHYVYRTTGGDISIAYGNREMCLNSAITGKWGG